MTRKIFWRDGVGANAKSSPRQSPAQKSPVARPVKRVKAETHEVEQEIKDLASSLDTKPNARKPSISSTCATIKLVSADENTELLKPNPQSSEPIEEIFMVEGLSKDDMYRMVEDEFYLTANTFTAHLHRAEYQRLQEEAKSQNALKIKNISRPVVGQATDLVKTKQDRISRLKKQKSARRKNWDSEDDDDDTFRSTTLFGLMESPRKKHPTLNRSIQPATPMKPFGASKVSSRADPSTSVTAQNDAHKPASVARRPHTSKPYSHGSDDDDDEDDLDAEPRSRSTSFAPRTTTVTKTVTVHKAEQSAQPVHSKPKTTLTNPQLAGQRTEQGQDKPQSLSDDDSADALFGFQKRAKNRARQKAKGTQAKQDQRSVRDVIPDFM